MSLCWAPVQGRPFQCLSCPAAFTCKQYLEIHTRTHTGERPYQCDICLKRFTQKSSLNIHKRTHSGTRRGAGHSADDLGQHERARAAGGGGPGSAPSLIAVQGRPFQCLACPAAFTCKQYLEIHNRTHTGERPYQCDVCLKRFAQKSTLNIHKRTHTGQFP